jgi:sigma-B regulation protein RsbU (phosphoserine phosphatase)
VTGHGLESGVLMIMVQTAVRTLLAIGETDPVRCLEAINQTIYANVKRMQSTRNLSLSLLSYQEGLLELSGQHENLIIIRQNGQLELIDTLNLGFPIGLERNILPFIGLRYIPLSSGDTVILYTDGITEATNSKGELYGIEQLLAVVLANFNLPVIEIKDAIIADVHKHIGSIPLYDDITLLVFRLREGSNP